ncbi:hypothetical protein BFP72_13400 [Reichenbachiella sp. 5M10]|uniref:hypothetical protein n=1 Tax=Reichenbachiella sp. 5M10 TaxID=1889772 RepID=UPI000C15D8FD|nr:hypothetical protein [Reichenbachiella sp. 5M10]PIB36318.1 hypothetical protein BFP72_13400 [Reichenbachiella sp. 5M10]
MLSYFKANDPYRLLGAFLLLLLIRVSVIVSGVPPIMPELKWLLLGERLSQDGMLMYRDVWDYTAPLSVFVYKWLHILFGKSRLSYQLMSMLLVAFQAMIFNNIMLKNKAYNTNSYVPALIYVITMNFCFDFMTLSPVLMAMTFILLALNNLFKRMDNHTQDELFIFTGIYLGVATMFYLPSIFYVLVTLIALLLYTGSIFRRMLLLFYGFLMVLVLTALFFYWNDGFSVFYHHVYKSLWSIGAYNYLSVKGFLLMLMVPGAILGFSLFKVYKMGKFVNFQSRIQSVMLMFLVSGLFAFTILKERSTFQFIYFVPVWAFFITHYLLLIRNWILAEASFLLVLVLLLSNFFFPLKGWMYVDRIIGFDELIVQESEYATLTEGKKILVIGEGLRHYQRASIATPYLEWRLSKELLSNLDYYDNSAEVFRQLNAELPEVIIDEKQVVPELFEMMPTIAAQYREHPVHEGVYVLLD